MGRNWWFTIVTTDECVSLIIHGSEKNPQVKGVGCYHCVQSMILLFVSFEKVAALQKAVAESEFKAHVKVKVIPASEGMPPRGRNREFAEVPPVSYKFLGFF